ncbi:hypothetical protein [Myxococcus qinghaiensis]|uniref:hypothetical protein n=1 Tax=Myxococcus qinghaiensis TaxID=2906758 RepID=UPI0020A75968|nr:hypothetical protein [Myxococcus qinghaiensis]MCP3163250.1 hypothetical protein [Myxococcus qinghaiensis]
MNGWKVAFFVMLPVWGLTLLVGAYAVVNVGTSQTHMSEGYADCEAHRDWLDTLARGHVTREHVRDARPKVVRTVDEHSVTLKPGDIDVRYDDKGRYVGSQLGASTTPLHTP